MVEILPTGLRITMKNDSSHRNNVLFDRSLFGEIVPEKSRVKFLPMKVSKGNAILCVCCMGSTSVVHMYCVVISTNTNTL